MLDRNMNNYEGFCGSAKKRSNAPPSTQLYSAKLRPSSAKAADIGPAKIKRINITTNTSNQLMSGNSTAKNAMMNNIGKKLKITCIRKPSTNPRSRIGEEEYQKNNRIISATPQERKIAKSYNTNTDEKQPNLRELLKEACQVIKRRKEEVGSIIAVNNIRSNSNRHNK